MKNLNLGLSAIFFILVGCANWALKKQCENTNWFDYGQQVAFQGRYLEEDKFVKDCKEVDIIGAQQIDLGFKAGREKMCTYDEMFTRGKAGEPVNFEFCDALSKPKMLARHKEGLKVFCTKDNGYPYGKSGKQYKNVCSPDQEKAFMPTYYKGRKDFLTIQIKTLKDSLQEHQGQYANLANAEGRLSHEYSMLPHFQDCRVKDVFNPATQRTEQKTVCEEAYYIKVQRDRLSRELSEVRGKMVEERQKIDSTVKEIEVTQNELNKIPI